MNNTSIEVALILGAFCPFFSAHEKYLHRSCINFGSILPLFSANGEHSCINFGSILPHFFRTWNTDRIDSILKHFCRFPSLLDRFFYTRWRWLSTWLADLILIGCEVVWIYKEKVTMFTILFWQFTKKWAPPSVEEIPALKLRSDLKVF